MAQTQEGRSTAWNGTSDMSMLASFDHSEDICNASEMQPGTGFEHVSAPMGRILHEIGVRMLRRRYGLSAGHAAAVANLLVMGGTAHG